jgi:hypothetical protein
MNRVSTNMSVRSSLFRGSSRGSESIDEELVCNVLTLVPGTLDLERVEALRRSQLKREQIPRLRFEGLYRPRHLWSLQNLLEMQFATRPVAGSDFCHSVLAMTIDFGVDVDRIITDRILALLMATHDRLGENSLLGLVGDDCIKMMVGSLYRSVA